jgi:hypothetical protein
MEITKPHLTSYQKDILFSKARFTITEASTKVGKTYSHIIWLFGKAHEYEEGLGKNYWWVAPVYNQTKIAFKRLRRNLAKYGYYRFNETNLIIHCPNGAEIHTADIARLGKDKTVIYVWDGLRVVEIIEKDTTLVTESANLIKDLMAKYNVNLNNKVKNLNTLD